MPRTASTSRSDPTGSPSTVERHAAVWPEMLQALHDDRLAQLLPVPARRRPAGRVLRDRRPRPRPRRAMAATEVNAPLAGRDGRVLRRPRRPGARRGLRACSTRSSTWTTSWRPGARRTGTANDKTHDDDDIRRDRPAAGGPGDRGALVGVRQLRHPVQGVRHRRAVPRTVQEKIADAAKVHRFTGARADGRAAHPVGPGRRLRARCARTPRTSACDSARSTRTPSRTTTTSSGALTHTDAKIRQKAIDHHFECIDVMDETGSRDLKIWLADGTNYPGQDDMRGRQDRLAEALADDLRPARRRPAPRAGVQVLRAGVLPHRRPGLGHVVRPGAALGERAMVCLDTGHHAPGTNIEFIVAQLLRLGKLGSFDFNCRFYADDDLIVGAADPFQLFRILRRGRARRRLRTGQRRRVHARPVPQHRAEDPRARSGRCSTCRR